MPSRLAALHGSAGLACYVETQTHQALLYDRLPSPNRIIAPIPFTVRWIWDANKNKTSEAIVRMMSDYRLTIPSGGYDDADRRVRSLVASAATQFRRTTQQQSQNLFRHFVSLGRHPLTC